MTKRMTKDEFKESLGALKPVGYIVLALPGDDAAAQAVAALREEGYAEADILQYTSAELQPKLDEAIRNASGAAGFGYEIVLMRRYAGYANQGAGWVFVYAPDDDSHVDQVRAIARRLHALSAVRYGRLVNEDLI